MKSASIFIFISIFLSACSMGAGNVAVDNTEGMNQRDAVSGPAPDPAPESTGANSSIDASLSYADAVAELSKKVAMELKNPGKRQVYSPGTKSFFIYNAGARDGEESELARRFIDDMIGSLVKEKIRIKREKLATWARAASGVDEVECQEVLETLAANFLMGVRLRECVDSENCMEANVEITARESNDLFFAAKETFRLKGAAARWHRLKHETPPPKGSRDNPYVDEYEAAKAMVGRLSCMAKILMTHNEEMRVVVGKTDNTPVDAAHAFSEAVSIYGLSQVVFPDKWLPVAIREGDRFELGMYRKQHRDLFESANVSLALDMKDAGQGVASLQATLMALRDMEIVDISNGKRKMVRAGMVFPYCSVRGYSYTSIKPMPVGAAAPSENHENETPVKMKNPGKPRRSINPALRSEAARAAYQKSQEILLRDLNRRLYERLVNDEIPRDFARRISIRGELALPDCREEDHYLAPRGVPPRHYCTLNYDVDVMMDDDKLAFRRDRARGMGSSRDAAWEDALLGVIEDLLPQIRDMARAVIEKNALENR